MISASFHEAEVTSDDALMISLISIHGQHVTDATGPPSFFKLFIYLVHQVLTCGIQDQLP